MENIYIKKRVLGDELCYFLGYDEMSYDEKISLDLLFNKLLDRLKEIDDENTELKEEITRLTDPYAGSDELYEQSVGK